MSFTFKWPRFSDQFHAEAREMLHAALNKGSKPPIIADKIEVVELEMGTQPPELEIKDIGELTKDQFRGIFKLTYAGDAFIVLRTKVQANPLNHRKPDTQHEISELLGGGNSRGILAAHQPLLVPMLLRLSQFRLNSYVVLVLSKQKGCTLVFKTDPLQNVEVSSTFDSIAVIQSFIQREIEEQLREMFREDLPGIIHRLSQRWVAGRTRVEAPYLRAPAPVAAPGSLAQAGPRSIPGHQQRTTFNVRPSTSVPDDELLLFKSTTTSLPPGAMGIQPGLHPAYTLNRRTTSPSIARSSLPATSVVPPTSLTGRSPRMRPKTAATMTRTPSSADFPRNPTSTLPDIENFDPTYGLRSEGVPAESGFSGFGKLFGPNRGLADLAEDAATPGATAELGGLDGESAYDVVEWEEDEDDVGDSVSQRMNDDVDDEPGYVPPLPPVILQLPPHDFVDVETIPAVGGGFITRPRISTAQSTSAISPPLVSMGSTLMDIQDRIRSNVGAMNNGNRTGARSEFSSADSNNRADLFRRVRGRAKNQSGLATSLAAGAEVDQPAYNPYFGESYRQGGDFSQYPGGGVEIESTRDLSSSQRQASKRPMPVPHQISSLSDRARSISRSPPAGDSFPVHYGSPSHQHHATLGDDDGFIHENVDHSNYQRSYGRSSHGIILRNQSVSHLSALSKSNQTLSPFTRSFSHFTVRSGPPRPLISNTTPFPSTAVTGAKKARRKRVYRLGGTGKGVGGREALRGKFGDGDGRDRQPQARDATAQVKRFRGEMGESGGGDILLNRMSRSPAPPSEFSDDDVEHYFRPRRPSEVVLPPLKGTAGGGSLNAVLQSSPPSSSSHLRKDERLLFATSSNRPGSPAPSGVQAVLRQRTTSHSSQKSRQRKISQTVTDA
ncbi:ERMES complex subunit [Serendipita sp. 399]|nr:ERMES complex subunit [Serendipita sp. 399]